MTINKMTNEGDKTIPENGGGLAALARLVHSSHQLRHNSEGRILALMSQAGFASPKTVSQGAMLFGRVRINYYQASVPTSEGGALQPAHTNDCGLRIE